MSTIGGPGGIGGPKGARGPAGPEGPDEVQEVGDAGHAATVEAARATRAVGELEAMAADIAAGKLTAHEAIDRLVAEIAGTAPLDTAERAELRDMLADLVENDPYLQSLVGRL
jgi:hypothetical protein